jgi:uncharacterized protein (DUF427 family)
MALLVRSDHAGYRPYKSDASYFDLRPLENEGANAVWTYEKPYPVLRQSRGRAAPTRSYIPTLWAG